MRVLRRMAAALLVAAAGLAPAQDKYTAIVGAHVIPVAGPEISKGAVVWKNGLIEAVGAEGKVPIPPDAEVVRADGKYLMPGIIDTHSHMGVYSWPGVEANSDGNEMTAPITAQVRAEDAINLEDPAWERARAGGVTTALILPGSGNMIGGEGVVLKLRPNQLLDGMKLAGAPRQLKMAMGENPKRVYGGKGQMPSTRMGIMAKHREVWTKAKEYAEKQARHQEKLARFAEKEAAHAKKLDEGKDSDAPDRPEPPEFDGMLSTLADVLAGKVRVQVHCYRKDDIMDILRVSDEFGFKIAALHHVLEGYKVPEELVARGIGASTWPDWWGFKMESHDGIPQGMAIMANAGVVVALQSDSANIGQRLYHEAAKAAKYGMTRQQALESITINGAKILGTDKQIGTLEPGKSADFAIYSADPFDMYATVEKTWIDGVQVFDREQFNQKLDLRSFVKMTQQGAPQ